MVVSLGSDRLASMVRDDCALFGVPTHSNEEGSAGAKFVNLPVRIHLSALGRKFS